MTASAAMKSIGMFTVGILVLAGTLRPATVPDFTGEWVMDAARTSAGSAAVPNSRTDVIDHREPNLSITRTQVTPLGKTAEKLNYTTDGRENKNTSRFGTTTSTAGWDGSALSIRETLDAGGLVIKRTQRMSLSPDGKTLTILISFDEPSGNPQSLVFGKK